MDSILDVLGIAVALDTLGAPEITSAPLPVGSGHVKTRHGILSVPVPVVRDLSARYAVPLVSVPVLGETVTPTGIAVLAAVCRRYVLVPRGRPDRVGVGAGHRRFADRPNVLRAYGFLWRA